MHDCLREIQVILHENGFRCVFNFLLMNIICFIMWIHGYVHSYSANKAVSLMWIHGYVHRNKAVSLMWIHGYSMNKAVRIDQLV